MGREGQSFRDSDISQKPVLPVDEVTEDPEFQEAMDYLKSVREEAKSIVTCSMHTQEVGIGDKEPKESYNYNEFDSLINYKVSEDLQQIRRHPSYEKCRSEIVEYILSQKDKVSDLTEIFQTEETVSPSDWEETIGSAQEPSIALGKWNSYNWSSLLEHFAYQFEESPLDPSILNTRAILWITLALIAMHEIDSLTPHVAFCMQRIKRFLESNSFSHLTRDDHFRIETIIIIIKHIYHQL